MIGAGGVLIHLLQYAYICVLAIYKLSYVFHIGYQPFLGKCPGFFSAVHEKAVVRFIRTKAYVVGKYIVRDACCGRYIGFTLNIQREVILQPAVGQHYVGEVAEEEQHYG